MTETDLVKNTAAAFGYVDKLYSECAALICETEALLHEDAHHFQMGRCSGYAISSVYSRGLNQAQVGGWMLRRFSVFFAQQPPLEPKGGTTTTPLSPTLKVIYMRLLLDGYSKFALGGARFGEPTLLYGVLGAFEAKDKEIKKLEVLITQLEANEDRFLRDLPRVAYEDSYVKFAGELRALPLFDLKDSAAINERLVRPAVELYERTSFSLT